MHNASPPLPEIATSNQERSALETKALEFQQAMDRYHRTTLYKKIGIITAISIVSLQFISLVQWYCACHTQTLHALNLILCFLFTYFFTDFVNGLIHMYMDNNTQYSSFLGPLIAAFHLHHLTPRYTNKHPLKIYFYESGAKLWLVFYLAFVCIMPFFTIIPINLHFCMVCFGILSSVAEVSHYWCHNASKSNHIITFLQQSRILLSKKHHGIHHQKDNQNYAFLNGLSDPIINLIAHCIYNGYKNDSDLHAQTYIGQQTNNRVNEYKMF